MIPQMQPSFGSEELLALTSYAKSGAWFTEHNRTRELESMIADLVRADHCVMFPNCTLSLYAVLHCLGVGEGHDVIVPAFTMIATANAARMTGARVVFCDIDERNLCISRDWWKVHEWPSAVVPVALNGRSHNLMFEALEPMPDTDKGRVLCVEDAAQAFGSMDASDHLGTIGIAGVYSFGPLKIISSGQGGCAVTNSARLANSLRAFKTFGREVEGADDYQSFGVNLRYTDLQAVVLIEQMKKLPYRTNRKKEIFALYRQYLSGVDEVKFVETDLEQTVPWFVDIMCRNRDDRDGLMAYLKDRGVGSRAFYPPLHKTPVYEEYNHLSFPIAEDVSSRGLWLPSSVQLLDTEIKEICDVVKAFFAGG